MASDPTILSPEELESRLVNWAGKTRSYPCLHSESGSTTSAEELRIWLGDIEARGSACNISPLQWADIAIFFLGPDGELKAVMSERKARYLEETKSEFWDWDEFKADLGLVIREAAKISKAAKEEGPKDQITEFYRNHPYIAASASAGLIIGGSVVLLPALGVMALNTLGFTATGIAGGSFAATIQSIFYGGFTSGIFSIFQSIGATAVLPGASAVLGASTALGAGVSSLINMQRDPGDDRRGGEENGEAGDDGDDEESGAPPSPPPSLLLQMSD